MQSLEEVLARFESRRRAFFDPAAAERIAYEAVEDLAPTTCAWPSSASRPSSCANRTGWTGTTRWRRSSAASSASSREHDVAVGLIAIVEPELRDRLGRAHRRASRVRASATGSSAFDLAGDERPYPPSMYRGRARAQSRQRACQLTMHYGESGGPQFPREAIEALGALRLGHGVSVAADPEVTALARERGVTLEMCPTSNHRTNAVATIEEHPARRLLDEGVARDDQHGQPRPVRHRPRRTSSRSAATRLGFPTTTSGAVTANAIDASFVDEATKADVRERHFGWLERVGSADRAERVPLVGADHRGTCSSSRRSPRGPDRVDEPARLLRRGVGRDAADHVDRHVQPRGLLPEDQDVLRRVPGGASRPLPDT